MMAAMTLRGIEVAISVATAIMPGVTSAMIRTNVHSMTAPTASASVFSVLGETLTEGYTEKE